MKLRVVKHIIFFCYISYLKVLPLSFQEQDVAFILALNKQQKNPLLKFDCAKTALLGQIYNLKSLCERRSRIKIESFWWETKKLTVSSS